MKCWLVGLCAFGTVLLGGCDPQSVMNGLVPEQQERTAQHLIDDVRAGRIGLIEEQISPAYKDENTRATLAKVQAFFPKETPKSVTVVGFNSNTVNGDTSYNFTFEYQFSHTWLLAWANFKENGDKVEIIGIGVQPLVDSLENINAFRLTGKMPVHYAFLALVIFAAAFSLITFVVCLFTPIPSFKWAWAIAILFGVVQFTFNWTTGALDWRLFSIQLLSSGYVQQLYGPVILQVAIPLWAILFWAKRGGWMRAARGLPEGDMRTG